MRGRPSRAWHRWLKWPRARQKHRQNIPSIFGVLIRRVVSVNVVCRQVKCDDGELRKGVWLTARRETGKACLYNGIRANYLMPAIYVYLRVGHALIGRCQRDGSGKTASLALLLCPASWREVASI